MDSQILSVIEGLTVTYPWFSASEEVHIHIVHIHILMCT